MFDPAHIHFLSTSDVIAIHADTIAHEGGAIGLRGPGGLDAAVAMPRQSFFGQLIHPDLASMAAAYHFHIAKNHPFIDGNKRASVSGALVFLAANGHGCSASNKELHDITIALASSKLDKAALTRWWAERIVRCDA